MHHPLLSSADLEGFHRDGWLIVPAALDQTQLADGAAAVERIQNWAATGGPGLHHFEQTDDGVVLARTEDFVHHDDALRALICEGTIPAIVGELLGEPAVLYKEKINYKQPGGGGFAPHQDATAYRFVAHHISCMVPFDSATEASGCLWVAPGYTDGQLLTDARGRIDESVAAELAWQPAPVEPGDLLLFDSFTPHHSATNTTSTPRRAAYLTYNAASTGDHRERYYADKRNEFERTGPAFDGERVRISITDDFLGRPV